MLSAGTVWISVIVNFENNLYFKLQNFHFTSNLTNVGFLLIAGQLD